jgi:hypothetical protein
MKLLLTYAVMITLLTQSACSVYKAVSQPPPADLAGIGAGTARTELINRFGAPKFCETDPTGKKHDIFEFVSGFHQGSKARVIPYLAADFFSLGLAELILWPTELTLLDSAKCIANVSYDETQKVEHWAISRKGGGNQMQGC